MADFYQNGVVTTLHNLARRPTEELEAELRMVWEPFLQQITRTCSLQHEFQH